MLNARLLARLTDKKTQLDARRPLPTTALARLKEQLTIEWIYNSNAIEGNTLTLRETGLIVEHGLTIGGKSLREHFEVINHREAIDYVENLAISREPLTPMHVRQIHKLVLTRIDDQSAGQYRTTMVRITGAVHQPPEAWEVPQLMTAWGDWLNEPSPYQHAIERAALAHHRLASIHPFADGNGRTARLVMNLLLLRASYPPTIIQRVNRRQYYRVLAEADLGRPAPLINFVGRAVERSLTLYLEAGTPRPRRPARQDEWLPLRDLAPNTPYSQEYLSLLARTGRLSALKRGRVWHTTRRAVAEYLESVHGDSQK